MAGHAKLFPEKFEEYFQCLIVVSVLIVTGAKLYLKCEAFSPSWLVSMEVDKFTSFKSVHVFVTWVTKYLTHLKPNHIHHIHSS